MGTMDLIVVIIDESRENSIWGVKMEENQQVLEIQNVLVEKNQDMDYAPIFLFNQAGEVVGDDLEAPVKDVFKSGDTVIAYIGTAAPPEVQDKGKFVKKDITNKSGVEVRVVMTTRFLRQKVCFPDKRLYSIDFCKWSKTIEVYWATEEKFEGETKYIGKVYDLERPEKIWEYRILADGLYKIEDLNSQESRSPKLITPKKEGKVKCERHFLNPKETTFQFENTGTDPLCVISGRKTNFEVSPPVSAGEKLRIPIKENKNGFEFGLIPDTTSSQGGSSPIATGKKEYNATMFDSQALANVTMFNVWGTTGGFKASAVSTDGTRKPLENTRTKQYRESDRICLKYKLDKVVELFSTAANIASCAAGN